MVFMTDNMDKTDNCRKVFARGSVMSATIMDARVATIGKSVRRKMIKRDVLGSNPCEKVITHVYSY